MILAPGFFAERGVYMGLAVPFRRNDCFGTDDAPETAAENLRAAMGLHGAVLTGKGEGNAFSLTCRSRLPNPFRPELAVTLLPEDGGGTEVHTRMRLHPVILGFLCIWSAVTVGLAAWRGWLLLVMLPVFWGIALAGYVHGCKDAAEALRVVLYRRSAVLVEETDSMEGSAQ